MTDYDKDPITCVVVLYDDQIVTWKAGYSIRIGEPPTPFPVLSSKYYPDIPYESMTHEWKSFSGGEEKWEKAHEWMRQWPIHPQATAGFSAHRPPMTREEAQEAINKTVWGKVADAENIETSLDGVE